MIAFEKLNRCKDHLHLIAMVKKHPKHKRLVFIQILLNPTYVVIILLFQDYFLILTNDSKNQLLSSKLKQISVKFMEHDFILCGYDTQGVELPILQHLAVNDITTQVMYNLWAKKTVYKSKLVLIKARPWGQVVNCSISRALEEYHGLSFFNGLELKISLERWLLLNGHTPPILEDDTQIHSIEKYLLENCVLMAQVTMASLEAWIDTRMQFLTVFENLEYSQIIGLSRPSLAEEVIQLGAPDEIRAAHSKNKAKPIIGVRWSDIGLLYQYTYKKEVQSKFEPVTNLSTLSTSEMKTWPPIVLPGGVSVQVGKGGIHGIRKENTLYLESEGSVLYEVDITSFYPNLLLQILSKFKGTIELPYDAFAAQVEHFLKRRIELKKEKKPEAQAYKIVLNALVGSTNYPKSFVYQPKLNFSVTINGQLIMMELVNHLKSVVKSVIYLNTDGALFEIQRGMEPAFFESLQGFEKKYMVEFGTNRIVKQVAIQHVNRMLLQTADGSVETKGFSITEPPCFQIVLTEILKRGERSLTPNIVLEKLYGLELFDFMFIKSVGSLKQLFRYYFSRNPKFFGGVEVVSMPDLDGRSARTTIAKPHNISLCNRDIEETRDDICYTSYAFAIMKVASLFGFEISSTAYSYLVLHHPPFLVREAKQWTKLGLWIVPGIDTKSSLVKNKVINYLEQNSITFFEESLNKDPSAWLEATSLHLVLYPQSPIICLTIRTMGLDKRHPFVFNWLKQAKQNGTFFRDIPAETANSENDGVGLPIGRVEVLFSIHFWPTSSVDLKKLNKFYSDTFQKSKSAYFYGKLHLAGFSGSQFSDSSFLMRGTVTQLSKRPKSDLGLQEKALCISTRELRSMDQKAAEHELDTRLDSTAKLDASVQVAEAVSTDKLNAEASEQGTKIASAACFDTENFEQGMELVSTELNSAAELDAETSEQGNELDSTLELGGEASGQNTEVVSTIDLDAEAPRRDAEFGSTVEVELDTEPPEHDTEFGSAVNPDTRAPEQDAQVVSAVVLDAETFEHNTEEDPTVELGAEAFEQDLAVGGTVNHSAFNVPIRNETCPASKVQGQLDVATMLERLADHFSNKYGFVFFKENPETYKAKCVFYSLGVQSDQNASDSNAAVSDKAVTLTWLHSKNLPSINCTHPSCEKRYKNLERTLVEYFVGLKLLEEQSLFNDPEGSFKGTIQEALQKEGNSVIVSPPGSGKTHAAILEAIEKAVKGFVAVLVFPTKRLLIQSHKLCTIQLQSQFGQLDTNGCPEVSIITADSLNNNPAKLYEQCLNAKEKRVGCIHFTVHAYLQPVGDQPKLHTYILILMYFSSWVWMFIDEFHLFCSAITKVLPYERVIYENAVGRKSVAYNNSQLYTHHSNITRQEGHFSVRKVSDRFWQIEDRFEMNPFKYSLRFCEQPEQMSVTSELYKVIQEGPNPLRKAMNQVDLYNMEFVNYILPSLNPLFKAKGKPEIPVENNNPVSWLEIIVSTSYQPTLLRYRPFNQKTQDPMDWEDFKQYCHKMGKIKQELSKEMDRRTLEATEIAHLKEATYGLNVRMPSGIAFSSDCYCFQLIPLVIASKMHTTIWASATPSQFYLEALVYATKDTLNVYRFTPLEERKLDTLYAIQSSSSWFEMFDIEFWKQFTNIMQNCPFYALGFAHNYKSARTFFEFAQDHSLPFALIEGDSEIGVPTTSSTKIGFIRRNIQDSNSIDGLEGENKLFQEHSAVGTPYGVIGTGLNLADRKLLLINQKIFKPVSYFWSIKAGEQSLLELSIRERYSVVMQNIGRFARKTPYELKENSPTRRVAFLLGNVHEDTTKQLLLTGFQSMFHTVKVLDLDSLEMNYTTRGGTFNDPNRLNASQFRARAVKCAVNWLNFESDTINPQEGLSSKKMLIESNIHGLLEENPGITYTEIRRVLSIGRFDKEVRASYREFFKTLIEGPFASARTLAQFQPFFYQQLSKNHTKSLEDCLRLSRTKKQHFDSLNYDLQSSVQQLFLTMQNDIFNHTK